MNERIDMQDLLENSRFMGYCIELIQAEAESQQLDPADVRDFFKHPLWDVVKDVARRHVGMCATICTRPLHFDDQRRTYFAGLAEGFRMLLILEQELDLEARIQNDLADESRGKRSDYENDPIISALRSS